MANSIGDFIKNIGTDKSCVLCGRKVGKNPFWIHLSTSGQILPTDSESSDSQGFWPIGSECAKSFDPKVIIK